MYGVAIVLRRNKQACFFSTPPLILCSIVLSNIFDVSSELIWTRYKLFI